ncbi:MAG: glycosyltransferase [Patescibacteria group bacterium]|jgi:glycosyltransferase involved in cell wall biosynthesis
MKIIYIANSRIPTERAHGYQITKMCEQFAVAGAEVELLAPTKENSIKQDLFDFYGLERNFKFSLINLPDFLLYEKFLGRFSMYLQWLFFTVKMFFIKIDKDSLVYTRDRGAAWVFGLRGFKTCYESHNWPIKQEKLVFFLLKRVNYIVATNSFIKNEFIKKSFNQEKILVAPNGIDMDIFAVKTAKDEAIKQLNLENLAGAKDKKILLYTGSFRTSGFEKGIIDILKALKILNDKNIVFLAVGGNDKDIEYYKNIASEFNIIEQTYFFERQTQKELALFQRASDLLLMPFPKTAYYEFFMAPLKMFEYLAAGRPIIASDLPSIKEILNDKNCLFCRPGDSEDLAEKIKQALNDPVLSVKLSGQAVSDAEQYGWDKRAKNILEFISN